MLRDALEVSFVNGKQYVEILKKLMLSCYFLCYNIHVINIYSTNTHLSHKPHKIIIIKSYNIPKNLSPLNN